MIVVSNTSPITNLAIVGQLDLLRQLYRRVVIPPAVRDEMVAGIRLGLIPHTDIPAWLETKQVTSRTAVLSLLSELDEGEAEAITLAVELGADFLLLDERKGRVVAARLGLQVLGLLGVLVEAKHRGFVHAVKPIMDNLIRKAGFWISDELYQRALLAAGE